MTDTDDDILAALRAIDTSLNRLCETVADSDAGVSSSGENPITALRRVRSHIDTEVFAQQRQAEGTTLPASGSCVLQWEQPGTPPRRLVLDPTSDGNRWRRREHEWTGDGWRLCGSDTIENVAIRAPAEPQYPNPVDPLPIDTLLERIQGDWSNPDPDVLVFEPTATTTEGVLAAVDDELRYRDADSYQWVTIIDEDELYHHLEQQGQPTVKSLSETTLTRKHFVPSPLTDDDR